MSSEPAVPFDDNDKVEESPYVPPGKDRELRPELREEVKGPTDAIAAGRTERLLEPEYPGARPLGEIPHEPVSNRFEAAEGAKLQDAAESVGAAVGKAISTARDVPRRLSVMKERFTVIRGRVQEDTTTAAVEMRENARQKIVRARSRTEIYAHEYPLKFIARVGIAGFVLGMMLRAWRSSRRG
jgi:ElaB/YqjD/DUF883 family membrane-anchored ribosome-binding protein